MPEVLEFIGDFPKIKDNVLRFFDGKLTDLRSIENGLTYFLGLCCEEVSVCEVGINFQLQSYNSPPPLTDIDMENESNNHEVLAVIKVERKLYLFQLQNMNDDVENELFYNTDNLLFEE